MEKLLGLLLIFVAVCAQDETVTESLQRAQAELTIGHEFFERTIVNSREQLSAQIYSDSRFLTESHMNAYAEIKTIVLDTTAMIDALPVNPDTEECLTSARSRWEIQILRYGRRLSNCIDVSHRRATAWNNLMNGIHVTAHETGNQVQNLGVATLAETHIFDGRNSFHSLINDRFRIFLGSMQPYNELYQRHLEEFETGSSDALQQLIQCDRRLVEDFFYEALEDYRRARNCVPREE